MKNTCALFIILFITSISSQAQMYIVATTNPTGARGLIGPHSSSHQTGGNDTITNLPSLTVAGTMRATADGIVSNANYLGGTLASGYPTLAGNNPFSGVVDTFAAHTTPDNSPRVAAYGLVKLFDDGQEVPTPTGEGLELYYGGSHSYIRSINRPSTYTPMSILGSTLYFSGTETHASSLATFNGSASGIVYNVVLQNQSTAYVNNTARLSLSPINIGGTYALAPYIEGVEERTSDNKMGLALGTYPGAGVIYERIRIAGDGNVGIGNTAPSYMLTMEASGGGYYSASDHQWHNGSSASIKTNIVTMATNVLSQVLALRPVTYDCKSSGKSTSGFIAEEVVKVIPEAVDMNKDDPEKADGLTLQPIVAALVQSLQMQQQTIKSQQADIEDLKARVVILEKLSEK